MPKRIMYLAIMDTERYQFMAVANTAKEAMDAVAERWNRHAVQYDVPKWNEVINPETGSTVGEYYAAQITALEVGKGYRDGESAD